MKKLALAAALLLSASTAYAGESYSFEIGGRTVRIHAPTGCDSPSCISISIPGVYHSRHRDSDDADAGGSHANEAPTTAAVPAPTTARPVPPPPPVASAPAKSSAAPMQAAPAAVQPAPAARPPAPQPQQQAVASATGSSAASQATVVATAAAPAPVPVARPTGPLGMWLTEKKEGRVRIEECGTNLCGYSIDARTGHNKEKVLINMRPSGSKWSGRIYDPNSGSTYSSTIAMRGTNALRVQGCAFGGLFCGGQTWTRID